MKIVDFRVEGVISVDTSAFIQSMNRVDDAIKATDHDIADLSAHIDELAHRSANINVEISGHAVEQIREIKTDIDELSRKQADVKVEVTGHAVEDISRIKTDVDELGAKGADIKVVLEDTEAMLRADRLSEKIDELKSKSADVRVKLDDGDAILRLDALDLKLDRIGAKTVDPNIRLDGMIRAEIEASALNHELNKLDRASVGDNVDRDIKNIGSDADAAAKSIGGEGGFSMMGAILMLAPAAAPILTTVAGGIGAIASSSAVAGAGLGAFAIFAVPTIKRLVTDSTNLQKAWTNIQNATTASQLTSALKKQKEILDSMSPAEATAVKAIIGFENEFKSLQKMLEPDIFRVLTDGLGFVTRLLKEAEPVAHTASVALSTVIGWANKGLDGKNWQNFFEYIRQHTGTFIDQWGLAIGNVVTGIANMIVAFDPLTRAFNGGMVDMSEKFLHWSEGLANNKGWQHFVDMVRTDAPLVMGFIGKTISLLAELVPILDPIGQDIFKVVDSVIQFASAFAKAHPALVQIGVPLAGFLVTAKSLMPVLKPIWEILSHVGPLGEVGIALGVISIAFAAINSHGAALKPLMTALGDAWTKYLVPAGNQLKGILQELGAHIMPILVDIGNRLIAVLGPGIEGIAKVIHDDFVPALQKILPIVEPIAEFLLHIFGDAVIGAVHGALTAIKGALEVISGLISLFADFFTGHWSKLWDDVKSIAEGVWHLLTGALETWLNVSILKGFKIGVDLIKSVWDDGWKFVKSIFDKTGGAIKGAVEDVMGGIKSAINRIIGWVKGFFSAEIAGWKRIFDGLSSLPETIKGYFDSVVGGIKEKMGEAITFITGIPGKIVSALGDLGHLLWNAGSAIIGGLLGGLKQKFEDVKNFIGGIGHWISKHKGPLDYDATLLVPHGQAIMAGLQEGLKSQIPSLGNTLKQITQTITDTSSPTILAAATGAAVAKSSAPVPGAGAQNGKLENHIHLRLEIDGEPIRAIAKDASEDTMVDLDSEVSSGTRPSGGI